MDLRSLETFLEVAERSSFTRAGEYLGYSQPTVSFQIRQLEQELGVPLFDRIGHTVTLTDAGREALDYAQRICNLSREMTMGARQDQTIRGSIRLGMADSLCDPLIARNFHRFRRDYPGITLRVFNAGTGELVRMLDHNEADMICSMDSRVCDMSYVTVQEEAIGVHFVASGENPLAKKAQVGLKALLEQPFLLTEKGMSYRRLMEERLAEQSLAVQPVLETARADLICDLVARNMGISFLPDYVTQADVDAGRMVRLPVAEVSVTVWMQILYRRDKWLSPQMKALIRCLAPVRLSRK